MVYAPYPYYPDVAADPRFTGGPTRGWNPFNPYNPYDPRDWIDGSMSRGASASTQPRTRGGCSEGGGFDFRGAAGSRSLTPDDFSNAVTVNERSVDENGASTSLEPMIIEELRRCARGLRGLKSSLDDRNTGEQAKVAAVSYFFYALGLLFTKGVSIPRDIPQPGAAPAAATTRGGACADFGDAVEKFIDKYTRGLGRDIGDVLDKGKGCFDHLTK